MKSPVSNLIGADFGPLRVFGRFLHEGIEKMKMELFYNNTINNMYNDDTLNLFSTGPFLTCSYPGQATLSSFVLLF